MASSNQPLPSFLPPPAPPRPPTRRSRSRTSSHRGWRCAWPSSAVSRSSSSASSSSRLWSLQILSPGQVPDGCTREPAAARLHRGAQGDDRRPARPRDRAQRLVDGGRRLAGQPAQRLGPRHRGPRAREDPRHPVLEARQKIRAHQDDPLTPVTLKVAVSPEVMAYLDEHQSEFPGVDLKQTYLRSYPAEELFAQVLGYVGEISAEQLKRMRKEGYVAGRPDRAVRRRGGVRPGAARGGRTRRAPRRLARAARRAS